MSRRPAAPPAALLTELARAHRLVEEGDVHSVARAFLPLLRRHCGVSFAALLMEDPNTSAVLLGGGKLSRTVTLRRYQEERQPGLAKLLIGRRRRRWSAADLPTETRRRGDAGIAIPLGAHVPGRARVLVAERDLERLKEPTAAAVLAHLGTALRNVESFRLALDLSFRDELAGVYNYRYLMEALDREARRAQRFDHVFSIIMFDLDNLKEYNDRHGHLQGSEVIRTVGGMLLPILRKVDLPAKYGGDEFVVVLPRADKRGALKVAERIRRRIEKDPFPVGAEPGAITASFGVSCFPEDGKTPRVLLRKADRALYRAKAKGRNSVSD